MTSDDQLRTAQICCANLGLSRKALISRGQSWLAARSCGPSHNVSVLPFCQSVELKGAALMPQPSVGVGDATHANRGGVGRGGAHGVLDFGDDFWRLRGRTHPADAGDASLAVHFHLQHPDGIQQWGQFAAVDAVGILGVNMAGCITPVGPRGDGLRGQGWRLRWRHFFGFRCFGRSRCGGGWQGGGSTAGQERCNGTDHGQAQRCQLGAGCVEHFHDVSWQEVIGRVLVHDRGPICTPRNMPQM